MCVCLILEFPSCICNGLGKGSASAYAAGAFDRFKLLILRL